MCILKCKFFEVFRQDPSTNLQKMIFKFDIRYKGHSFVFTVETFNSLPDDKFYSSILKDFADDNFKFDGNSRKLFKPVENTVGKGEIARYEQFLLFPQ